MTRQELLSRPKDLKLIGPPGEIETKADDLPKDVAVIMSGYATTWGNPDLTWPDIITRDTFSSSIDEFLKTGFVGGINHDWQAPVGRPVEAVPDQHGLKVTAHIYSTRDGRDLAMLLRNGVVKRMSIGFRIREAKYLDLEEVLELWRDMGYSYSDHEVACAADGARLVVRGDLLEFSPVLLPANPRAEITDVRGNLGEDVKPKSGEGNISENQRRARLARATMEHTRMSILGGPR